MQTVKDFVFDFEKDEIHWNEPFREAEKTHDSPFVL